MAKTPAIERLRKKCSDTKPPEGSQISTTCSSFTGTKMRFGHGLIGGEDGKPVLAHRIAYEHKHGPIPKGMVIMHLCDNPSCCNPDHLILGTYKDNNHDEIMKGRSKGLRKNVLPDLIKRVCFLQNYGMIPEGIAIDTGYSLTVILSLLDFIADDEYIYECDIDKHGKELADDLRMARLVYDQHTLIAVIEMLNTDKGEHEHG